MFRVLTSWVSVFLFLSCSVSAQTYLADESLKLTAIAADPHYGFEETYANSIKVGTDENIVSYLRALRGPHGENVRFSRIGSCCAYEIPGSPGQLALLARWKVTYLGLEQPITLYLNKNVYDNPLCPIGFTFATPATVVMPRIFPADSIRRVKSCKSIVYSVADPLLNKSFSSDFPQPDSLPHFKGGATQLKSYFAANPLKNPEAQRMVFRVIIAIMVNCEGNAGNARIITSGKGELATYANEVLAVVNRMPQNWVAALKNSKPADCWQTLGFTVVGGRLDSVNYR